MSLSFETSKYFRWGMNALLLVAFPAFLSFLNWAIEDQEANWVKGLILFNITCPPLMFSLFFNLKFLAPLLRNFQEKQTYLWLLFVVFFLFYVAYSFMFAFTDYLDTLYAHSFGLTAVIGMFGMIRYIKSGKS